MLGTSVRDSRYEVSIAYTTASASGGTGICATPVSSTTGKKTMQIDSVPTKVGAAICARAVQDRDAQRLAHRVVAMDVLDFHRRVIDQHADRQRESAQGHDVDGLAATA